MIEKINELEKQLEKLKRELISEIFNDMLYFNNSITIKGRVVTPAYINVNLLDEDLEFLKDVYNELKNQILIFHGV